MKTINLLPGWYLQQRRKQRHFRLHVLTMLALGCVLSGASFLCRQRLAAVERSRDALARQFQSLPDQGPKLQKQTAELQRLQELLLARRELGSTIPMSSVIQQLQNGMTPGMALSHLEIVVRPEPMRGSGTVGDSRNPPRYRDEAHMTVVGISPPPDNTFAMQFYNNIVKNPLFSEVTLDYTKSGILQGYPVRTFEIQLTMDLDKLSTDTTDAANQAAQASPVTLGTGGEENGR